MANRSLQAAVRKIRAMAPEIERQLNSPASGVRVIGEEIRTDVAASRPGKGVPKDLGNLASTLQTVGPRRGVVTLRAGGAAAPYALAQHERLDYRHEKGEARYWIRGLERWAAKPGVAGMNALRANAEAGIRAAARR